MKITLVVDTEKLKILPERDTPDPIGEVLADEVYSCLLYGARRVHFCIKTAGPMMFSAGDTILASDGETPVGTWSIDPHTRPTMCDQCWIEHGQDGQPCHSGCGCHDAT